MVAVHEPVPGGLGPERLPPGLPALRGLRDRQSMPKNWGGPHREDRVSRRVIWTFIAALALVAPAAGIVTAQAPAAQGARQGGRATATPPPAGGAARGATAATPQRSPGAGPVVVLETVKGTIEFETYPNEAPKTVEHILT